MLLVHEIVAIRFDGFHANIVRGKGFDSDTGKIIELGTDQEFCRVSC